MTSTASPADPPADDEIVTQILARRRRRLPMITLALGVAVVLGAGFVGGAYAQRHYGSTSSSANNGGNGNLNSLRSQIASRFGGKGGGTFTFPGGGSFGGAGAPTIGTVTLIKGNDLYVTTSSGSTVIVHAASATVSKTVTGTVKTILPGDTVSVVGTQGKNGSTTARSITIQGGGNG